MEPTQIRRGNELFYDFGRYFDGKRLNDRLKNALVNCGFVIQSDGPVYQRDLKNSEERLGAGYLGGGFIRGYWFIIESPQTSEDRGRDLLKEICDCLD